MPAQENQMDKDLYRELGVERDADAREIKKAYFTLAKEHHPDKGGDAERFKKVQKAYDILSDNQKRSMYDMTGDADSSDQGMRHGPMGPMGFGGMPGMPGMPGFAMNVDINDLFGNMFRGHQEKAFSKKRPKGPHKQHDVPLRLADFYNGKKIRFDLERQIFCETCSGAGCAHWNACPECRGSGVRETIMQMGPGMVAVNRGPCGRCRGEGKMRGKECDGCQGKGLVGKAMTLDVVVTPGIAYGEVLIFESVCSDNPDYETPGDFHIRLVHADEEEGMDVIRMGNALQYECEISLSESLLGCKRIVKGHPGHPGGLDIVIPQGTQNGEVLVKKQSGMPNGGDFLTKVHVKVSTAERAAIESQKAILESIFTTL